MKKYALFIEPEGDLRELILHWKQKVETVLPGQPYCAHPPHSTLIYGAYAHPDAWIDELKNSLSRHESFELQTREMLFFYDDALAGGHTAAFKVEPLPALQALQRTAADLLKNHLAEHPAPAADGLLAQEPFRSSWMKYGFPFVGPHWVPHFTIASLKTAREHPLLHELAALEPGASTPVQQVAVYEVDGDTHTPLAQVPLGA